MAKNAKWINHLVYQEELVLKLSQRQVANKLGLETPPTILTNAFEEAIKFYNKSYPKAFVNCYPTIFMDMNQKTI